MNARFAGVLVVLLIALGGGSLLVREQQRSRQSVDTGTLGQPLLKGLQASQIVSIAIRQTKDAITIAKKDERWTVVERAGFPADYDKVRDFVIKAIALKIGQSEPIGEKDRARLLLDAGGTTIEFLGADGKPLARLIAGQKYFKVQPERPETANADGRYVALPGDEKRVIVVADPLVQAATRTADWINKAGFAAEKVKTLEVRAPEGAASGSSWRIERSGDNADWKLIGAGSDEKLDVTKANISSYSLSQVELADVAPAAATPAETGLDKPTMVTATTLDGLTYTLKMGKLAGDNYYATVAISGEAKPEGKDAEERLKKINERLPREKALSAYTLLIPKAKLEEIATRRASLLLKKEEKKK